MSLDATKWAWRVIALPDRNDDGTVAEHHLAGAASKLVLLSLADRAGEKTGRCWPSIRRIAKDTGLSAATVQVAISELEDRKLVVRISGDRKNSNVYELQPVPGIGTPVCREAVQGVPILDAARTNGRHGTSKEPSKNRGEDVVQSRRDYDNPERGCSRCVSGWLEKEDGTVGPCPNCSRVPA